MSTVDSLLSSPLAVSSISCCSFISLWLQSGFLVESMDQWKHKSQTNGSKVKAKLWIQISNMSAALLVPICTWSWSKYLRNLANLANVCFNEMMYFNYPVVILDKTSTDVLLLFVSSLHISIIIIYVKFKCVPCCLINVIHK